MQIHVNQTAVINIIEKILMPNNFLHLTGRLDFLKKMKVLIQHALDAKGSQIEISDKIKGTSPWCSAGHMTWGTERFSMAQISTL